MTSAANRATPIFWAILAALVSLLLSFPAGAKPQSAGAGSTGKPHRAKDLLAATNPHPVGATRDLPAGTVLRAADMEVLKDVETLCSEGNQLVVTNKAKLIGKKLRAPIIKHQPIFTVDVF